MDQTITKTYSGWLAEWDEPEGLTISNPEYDDDNLDFVCWFSDYRNSTYEKKPDYITSTQTVAVAELLKWIHGKQVSIRYWIIDKEVSKEEASDAVQRTLLGDATVEFEVYYSDITGYLWTDENLMVGGHNLLEELRSFVPKKGFGNYLILEVTAKP